MKYSRALHVKGNEMRAKIDVRLEYLRGEIVAERISAGEIAELQSLVKYIEPGDTLLLEWAGVPENTPQCDVCSKKLHQDNVGNWMCEDDDLHNKEEIK